MNKQLNIDEEERVSVMTILKDSMKILPKIILPTLITVLILSVISSLLNILFLTEVYWRLIELEPDALIIEELVNSDAVLTEEQLAIQLELSKLYYINLIIQPSMKFVPLIGTPLFLTGKIYNIYTEDEDTPHSWGASIKSPFRSKKHTLTSVFILVFYPFILSIAMIMLFIPGFLFIIYVLFSYHSLILDDKNGLEVIRGSVFYAKQNFTKIIILIFISIFLPLLISNLFSAQLLDLLGFTDANLTIWFDPANRNYVMIFLTFWIEMLFDNMLFFLFPVFYTVAFYHFREEKLASLGMEKSKIKESRSEAVKIVQISPKDKNFNCPVCREKLKIGTSKCHKCGQLIRVTLDKKKKNLTL